jgi:D-sedoheptulose 7-phosphate isomerase
MFNLQEYLTEYVRVLRRLDAAVVERMAESIVGAWLTGRTVFLCGNGGSASSASHIATDLTKLTAPQGGPRLRAVSLTESASTISAIANDIAFDQIFTEQLRAFCQRNDVVIGLSTSGSSPNVLSALEYANSVGATTLGITGRNGRLLRQLAKHTLIVDSTSVQHTEDATMVAGHVLCLRVREALQVMHVQSLRRQQPATLQPAPVSVVSAATA